MTTLGQRIRELREEKDLSLRELAAQIKVSAPFMSDVERDRRHPSDQRIAEIARVLGTSPEELKRFDTRPPLREFQRAIDSDPQYGFAFRQMLNKNVRPEDILDFIEERERPGRQTD